MYLIVRWVFPLNGFYADGHYEKFTAGGNWIPIEREKIQQHLLEGGVVWTNPTEKLPHMTSYA